MRDAQPTGVSGAAYHRRPIGRADGREVPSGEAGFGPPPVPAFAVSRRRLALLLDIATHQRLTMVVAPPGYGKTVLLSQWGHSHPAARIRWMTLTARDDSYPVFAARLLQALRGGGSSPALTAEIVAGADAARDLDDRAFAVIDQLPPTTLVLDDFHQITDARLLERLVWFVEHSPRSLRVILASQMDPPSSYYHIAMADELVELRQADLAFGVEEAAALLHNLGGHVLSQGHVETLVARTEGWAAGLQLAALSLRKSTDPDSFIEAFAGDDLNIANYLIEHVLSQQPELRREFLLRTSVLDRLCGSLCDHLTGRSDGAAMLEDLHRRSLFTNRIGSGSRWFRYHPLFRATLRQYLRERDPALETALLRSASQWYMSRGDADSAAQYLVEAGSWDDVFDLALTSGGEMLTHGRSEPVAAWIRRAPRHLRARNVPVTLAEAAALAVSGRPSQAAEVLDAAWLADRKSGVERAVIDLLNAYAALRDERFDEAVRLSEEALGEGIDDPGGSIPDVLGLTSSLEEAHAGAEVVRGVASTLAGELERGRGSLSLAARAVHPMWQSLGLSALAMNEAWSGRLSAAERAGTRTLTVAYRSGLDQEYACMAAYVGLAVVARERDDLFRARVLLNQARSAALTAGSRIGRSLVAVEEAALSLAEGQAAAGLRILGSDRAGTQGPVPAYLVARRRALESELLLLSGEWEGAARALDMAPVATVDVASARVLLAVEKHDRVGARGALEHWPDRPQPRAGLEHVLWTSVVDHMEGRFDVGQRRLASVVAEATVEHHIGLFRNRHIVGPARTLYRDEPSPFLRTICEQQFETPPPRRIRGIVEQLTEREFMLLPLLPTRLTNAEIAEALGVSLNTVKTHLKHIYRKLGVTERSEAIGAAERLHLW